MSLLSPHCELKLFIDKNNFFFLESWSLKKKKLAVSGLSCGKQDLCGITRDPPLLEQTL